MMERFRGNKMGIFKKIWHWLFGKKEVESYEDIKAKVQKDSPIGYATGGYISPDKKYEPVGIVHTSQVVDYDEYLKRVGIGRKVRVNPAPITPRPSFAPPPQNPPRDFKREADEHFRQQEARRNSDDNFLMGAMVGYVIADSLNDSPSHRNVEEAKSSYDSGSSSSYDSGSYSSSYDSGSSSSSCDSGC